MHSINPNILIQSTLENLSTVSHALIEYAGTQKIWLFSGEIGVGKTTLIKSICTALQVQDIVTSPTFSVVNEYRRITNEKVYHFDCFRIDEQLDRQYLMEHIDFERYTNTGNYCFIEWPLQFLKLFLHSYFHITMTYCKEYTRTIQGVLQLKNNTDYCK